MRFMGVASITTNTILISEMGPWAFWARPEAIGLEPADVVAIKDGSATPEQVSRMQTLSAVARHILITAPAFEPFRRPS